MSIPNYTRNGIYRIRSGQPNNSTRYLELQPNNVVTAVPLNPTSDAQRWRITINPDSTFRIACISRDRVLSTNGTGSSARLVGGDTISAHTWTIEPRGDLYIVGNTTDRTALHITEAGSLRVWDRNNSSSQRWFFEVIQLDVNSGQGLGSASGSLPVDGPHDHFGFPRGYFQIRSVETGNVLTVGSWSSLDGATVCLWPNASNEAQVFFVDHTGVLCCKAGGNAVDVVDTTIVVRHRHPVTTPYPNPWSHPLPRFSYSTTTNRITVTTQFDPSLAASWPRPEQDWATGEFVLCARSSIAFRTRVHTEFSRWAPSSRFAGTSTTSAGITGGTQEHHVLIENHATDPLSLRRKMWEFIPV